MQRQCLAAGGGKGVDAAKALGATAVGLARRFLFMARGNTTCARQLRVAVWAVGAGSAAELAPGHLR
jgi:isopentenyl diphosphate isomerase/L-lactate dehydrogenase-like FMN-dependent dehydrogenase